MKQAIVAGVTLNYLEQGQGATVVFVHGAFSDHRNWDAQRAEVSKRYRFIALDQRYFGTAPWADNATKYYWLTTRMILPRSSGNSAAARCMWWVGPMVAA